MAEYHLSVEYNQNVESKLERNICKSKRRMCSVVSNYIVTIKSLIAQRKLKLTQQFHEIHLQFQTWKFHRTNLDNYVHSTLQKSRPKIHAELQTCVQLNIKS